jgi:O-acetyl-ADP-ribose deacetylase (regulator of RNase III)
VKDEGKILLPIAKSKTMGAALDRWRSWNAAKLPGRAVNRFVRGWASPRLRLEVHRTACIVTHPPGVTPNDALVNPANERLVGTQFSPEECWKELYGDPVQSRWDRDFATYPFQSVDGLVTEFGGEELKRALEAQPKGADGVRCQVGGAVVTRQCGELDEIFRGIVHAVPPFYRLAPDPDAWAAQMTLTYHSAFDAAQQAGFTTLAVPLLGAGARGAELEEVEALRAAAHAAVSWQGSDSAVGRDGLPPLTARFGVQDSTTAHGLADAIEDAICELAPADFEVVAAPPKGEERWAIDRSHSSHSQAAPK